MDDPRWLRLVTIGLILAAIAVGYFLFTGKFFSSTNKTAGQNVPAASVMGQSIQVSGSPVPSSSPAAKSNSATPKTAFDRIADRTQNQAQELPKTGFPENLLVVFSISAMISGWGLRKFPH